jgi:hypothetical protein
MSRAIVLAAMWRVPSLRMRSIESRTCSPNAAAPPAAAGEGTV